MPTAFSRPEVLRGVYLTVKLHDLFPASPDDESQKNWAHRVQELDWRRSNGNDYFRRRNMQLAQRCYEKGMEAAQVTKTVADVASNLSAVYLEQGSASGCLGRSRDASDHAKIAVDLVPKHPKASGAEASFLLGDFEECQRRLDELKEIQPEERGGTARRWRATAGRRRADGAWSSSGLAQFGRFFMDFYRGFNQ
eukprot:Skav221020  [mRNA]  locus=scaffold2350:434342:442425:- [translate_table: standard]